jgi:hypothetical protein
MPVRPCQSNGKPGYRWGSGKCYTYTPGNEAERRRAKHRAYLQGAAAEAAGYRDRESSDGQTKVEECMDCSVAPLAVMFDQMPKMCCLDQMLGWRVLGEGQKLVCEKCRTLLASGRIDKNSFLAENWPRIAAVVLRKAVFQTRETAEAWLKNNVMSFRYNVDTQETEPVGLLRETDTGFVFIRIPYRWFAHGTLKAQWSSLGAVVIIGNLLEEYDGRIPTQAELRETAEFMERV